MHRTHCAAHLFGLASLLLLSPGCDPGAAETRTPTDSLTYDLTPFTLQSGEEVIKCQYVPPDGKEHYISRFTADMKPGSHHLVVFRIDDRQMPRAAGTSPCTQIDLPKGFDGMLPGSQQRHAEFALPEGVAMKIEAYHGLLFQQHYINSTPGPISSGVTWKLDLLDPAQVKTTAGMLFYSNFGLMVPPGMSTVRKTCPAPADVNLVSATGHMHKHGIAFDAQVAGQPVYHSDTWEDPPIKLLPLPGLAVKAGTPIEWSCTYKNDGAETLGFGNSAIKNEMCIFASIFYPSAGGETEFFCLKH